MSRLGDGAIGNRAINSLEKKRVLKLGRAIAPMISARSLSVQAELRIAKATRSIFLISIWSPLIEENAIANSTKLVCDETSCVATHNLSSWKSLHRTYAWVTHARQLSGRERPTVAGLNWRLRPHYATAELRWLAECSRTRVSSSSSSSHQKGTETVPLAKRAGKGRVNLLNCNEAA